MTASLTLNPGTITRRLRAAGHPIAWTRTVTPGAVRVSVNVADGSACAEARAVSADLMRQGYEVARTGALILVTLPEPTEAEHAEPFTHWHECEEAMGEDLDPAEYAVTEQPAVPAPAPTWTMRGTRARRSAARARQAEAARRAAEDAARTVPAASHRRDQVTARVDLAAVDRTADHQAALAGWYPQSAAAELTHAAANARHIADRDPALAAYSLALAAALDQRAAEAARRTAPAAARRDQVTARVDEAPARVRTAVGTVRDVLAAAGITVGRRAVTPMLNTPGDVTVTLPADLADQVAALDALAAAGFDGTRRPFHGTTYRITRAADPTDAEAGMPERMAAQTDAEAAAEGWVAGPAVLTDRDRHLADCRGCALRLPDGHGYASLIDVPLTVEELRTMAARTDLDVVHRQAAEDALTELAEDAAPLDPDADEIAADHRYTVPMGAGSPPYCACGVVGGNGVNRPLLADHLRDVGHPDFD